MAIVRCVSKRVAEGEKGEKGVKGAAVVKWVGSVYFMYICGIGSIGGTPRTLTTFWRKRIRRTFAQPS